MLSIGIDIGTTTTQTVFSALTVENTASLFSVPRVRITGKRVIYKGEIRFTPYINQLLVDGDAVCDMVSADFAVAGLSPRDIDTGAVIITGAAARKENAAVVTEKLSRFAGDFVVSTAGPQLEAVLAGKGSGAQSYSQEHYCTVVNLDIGGGTTNIAVFSHGDSIAAGCLDIGGRILELDRGGTVTALSPVARAVAAQGHISLKPGVNASIGELTALAERLASLIAQELGLAPREPLLDAVRTGGCKPLEAISYDCICFSGGVAEYIHGGESHDSLRYGDLGVLLGRAIRQSRMFTENTVIGGLETIRATVVGAGSCATTVSGSTVTIGGDVLPLKNIPVLHIPLSEEQCGILEDAEALAERIAWFQSQSGREDFALSFTGEQGTGFARLERMAASLCDTLAHILPGEAPILVVMKADLAKALGQAMQRRLPENRPILCIDGVETRQGDYLDLGKPIMDGLAIPVIVKTLIFSQEMRETN